MGRRYGVLPTQVLALGLDDYALLQRIMKEGCKAEERAMKQAKHKADSQSKARFKRFK